MTRWRCPRCNWHTDQPAHVTGVTHRCRPSIPRAIRLVQQVPHQQEETT